MSWLSVTSLAKSYPGAVPALRGVDLSVSKGEFFAILGPTNAGKSTLLKTIAGVESPDAGTMALAGRDITKLEPRCRKLSLLFQNIALFPNRTGFDNIAFPMQVARRPTAEIEVRVAEIASLQKLGHVLDRFPRSFSGGEQQRVAIARALVLPADLLMLDEPLTNLDARLRIALRLAFKRLHRESGQTILYVTHDQAEALSLADRIGILDQGRFVQIGSPGEIYARPATEFVARFIGSPPMNMLDVEFSREGEGLAVRGPGFALPFPVPERAMGHLPVRAALGVRPEEIGAASEQRAETPFPGLVTRIERLGSHQVLDVRFAGGTIKVRTRGDHGIDREGPAWFGFAALGHRILDRETGLFLLPPSFPLQFTQDQEITSCA